MFSVKQRSLNHKPRLWRFILEALVPPLTLISSKLIDWNNLSSSANLIPGTTLILLWLVAGVLVWVMSKKA